MEPGEAAGADAAEEKAARQREWERARYRARVAAERCGRCGGPRAAGETARYCAVCREKSREYYLREKARRAAGQPPPSALPSAAAGQNPYQSRTCSKCGKARVRSGGWGWWSGRYRYACAACGWTATGDLPLEPREKEPRPCPNPGCAGTCWKNGFNSRGRQRYRCRVCGRCNTLLWPTEARPADGPFVRKLGLNLNSAARRGLNAYCQAHRMSLPRAVRAIFRAQAEVPRVRISGGGRSLVRASEAREPEPLPAHLPNLSAAATGRRMRTGQGNPRHHTVLVVLSVVVALDAEAYRGLIGFMRRTGLNHQEAARLLLAKAAG